MTGLRDWYLGALGIVRYVPRTGDMEEQQISGNSFTENFAESSIEGSLDRDQVSVAEAQTLKSDRAAARSEGATAALRQVLKEESASSSPVESHGVVDKPKAAAGNQHNAIEESSLASAQGEEIAPFRLAFWQSAASVAVLSALPPGARPSPGQQDMLANLLKAIGHLPAPLPQVEWIDWPLARQPLVSTSSAREFVETFLEVKHKLHDFSTVLLMGCGHLTLDYAKGIGEPQSLRCSATGLVTHSLQAMEQDPALKRETWEAIRHLAEK